MRISDWSSDMCSSDLVVEIELAQIGVVAGPVDARLGPPVLVEVVPAVGFQMAAPLVPLRPRVGAVPDGAVELADAALQFDAPAIGQIAVLAREIGRAHV